MVAKVSKKEFKENILPHIPKPKRGTQPKIDYHTTFCLIVFRLKTGMQWRCLSWIINAFGAHYSGNSVYRYFQKWCECEVFQDMLIDYLSQIKDKNLSGVYLD